MTDEATLLRQFVEDRSEPAFRELVRLRIDFVYAAALRQAGGDAHLAQEVAQNVFIDLARKAPTLCARANITGWLYTSTRFAAAKALRSRVRRLTHETEAHAMNEILSAESSSDASTGWHELRPVIDAALHELGEKDREAILLRFFEGRPLAEVGAAIGLAENSARMRVDRALEKLHERLARRGITSTAAALGLALAAQPVVAAPATLAASVAGTALAGAALGGAGVLAGFGTTLAIMSTTKLATVAAVFVALGALGGYWAAQPSAETNRLLERQATNASAAPTRTPQMSIRTAAALANPASLAAPTSATPAPVQLDPLRVLVDLQQRKLVKPEVKLVDPAMQLTSDFVELFALTPDEKTRLQEAVDTARARLAALARDNFSVGREPNGDVTLKVKAFPEEGGAAYDTMLKSFAEVLGPERHEAFMALGAEQAENVLGHFGLSHTTITFGRETTAEGEVRYRIHQEAQTSPLDHSNFQSDRMTQEEFVRQLGAFAELLPPDFLPTK